MSQRGGSDDHLRSENRSYIGDLRGFADWVRMREELGRGKRFSANFEIVVKIYMVWGKSVREHLQDGHYLML